MSYTESKQYKQLSGTPEFKKTDTVTQCLAALRNGTIYEDSHIYTHTSNNQKNKLNN